MNGGDVTMPRIYEVLTSASLHAESVRSMLVSVSAHELARGMHSFDDAGSGWMRPRRLSVAQARALESCLAWHPGLYRQMARTSAGVCLRFATDGAEVALAVRLDEEPRGTEVVLAAIDHGRRMPHDGISVMVDGQARGCAMPHPLNRSLPWMEDAQGVGIYSISLDEADASGTATMAIPGLGERHEVCIWLPCLRGCELRELWSDGTYIEPLPARKRLLVLGDSLGQGFCADDPMLAWPSLVAESLSLDLVNHSIGGQVFQPTALIGEPVQDVALVLVELGNNYRHEICPASLVMRDSTAYLREVASLYPEARRVAITPTGHDADACPVHEGSCAREVPAIVRVAARKRGFEIVDGMRLLDQGDVTLLDGEHPSAAGHAQMAARLLTMLASSGAAC